MRQRLDDVEESNKTSFLPDSLGWDAMIRDARKRIEDLKCSIELFEKKKAAGEPWPGVPSENPVQRSNTLYKTLAQFPPSRPEAAMETPKAESRGASFSRVVGTPDRRLPRMRRMFS